MGGSIVGEGQAERVKRVLVFEHTLLANRGAHQWHERRWQSRLGGLIPARARRTAPYISARPTFLRYSCRLLVDTCLVPLGSDAMMAVAADTAPAPLASKQFASKLLSRCATRRMGRLIRFDHQTR